jgi:hypothetical protein
VGKPLSHSRNFTEFLNQYGVTEQERAEAVEISAGLVPVIQVDDARHLVPPLPVRAAHYYTFEGAGGAGVYSGVQITAVGGSGLYVTWVNSSNSALAILGEPANPALVATGAVTTPQLIVGSAAPRAIVQTGTIAAAPPNGWITIPNNYYYGGCPFHLAAGATVTIFRSTLNSLFIANFGLQEIP